MNRKNAVIEKVTYEVGSSIVAVAYENAYFAAPLHKHPEYELILIEEGEGRCFVGDSEQPLRPGIFMLIGPNLSHLWLSADSYYEKDSNLTSKSVYAQFNPNIFPDNMSTLTELESIYTLLKESKRGLAFMGKGVEECKQLFRALVCKKGVERWVTLYTLLDKLSKLKCEYLVSPQYAASHVSSGNKIVDSIHCYLNANYHNQISLKDVAEVVCMSPSALCRYYKAHTGHTIFAYLSEQRIAYAVKLLSNSNRNIAGIAYDCGYNSLSHFNRQFRRITGYAPSDYVRTCIL